MRFLALCSVLLVFACNANTVWPKPQSQTDTGVLHTIEPVSFTFEAAGPGQSSAVLQAALKRYYGICGFAKPGFAVRPLTDPADAIAGATVTVASADETLALEVRPLQRPTVVSLWLHQINTA